jgi:hypothetical protein
MIENNYGQGGLEILFKSGRTLKISNENAQCFLCVSLSPFFNNELYTHIESFLNDYNHLIQKETINNFNITTKRNYANKRKGLNENDFKACKKKLYMHNLM